MTRRIRTYADLAQAPAGAGVAEQVEAQRARLSERLARVARVVAVGSAKGGVGKSFVAAHLAAALVRRGERVGALDADVNGPSLPAMLGVTRAPLRVDDAGVHPVSTRAGCTVISSDLLLAAPDAPLTWRGPPDAAFLWQSALETGVVREFLADVAWGALDTLVIDLPPGTDKIARALTLLPHLDLLIVVTTPARATRAVVARALAQARAQATCFAIVSNMEELACPACGVRSPLFRTTPEPEPDDVLLRIPFVPARAEANDRGEPAAPGSLIAGLFDALAAHVAATRPADAASP